MSREAGAGESVAILGGGTWGLSLACMLHGKGLPVVVWDAFPDYLALLKRGRRHPKLPELKIPEEMPFTSDLTDAAQADCLALVVASHATREVCEQLRELRPDWGRQILAICSKGIDPESLETPAQIAAGVFGSKMEASLGVLCGPSHAEEVSRGMPTTVVAASLNDATARRIQAVFMSPWFRVYTHDDVMGVELGASLKNVIAIAAGMCDGLGFGDNAKAALITRGLAEMARLGVAMGARPETFAGLTGMGDLIVTAGSRHSRNRNFGERIARGATTEQAQEEIGMVVEGIRTCVAAKMLADRHGAQMPITNEVYAVLNEGKSPRQAASDLMLRDPKPEAEKRQAAG